MLFDFDLIIPPLTPVNSPIETLAKLTRGRIKRIYIFFPPGPATLVHVVARHNLHQLVPANFDGTLNYDDTTIITELDYELVDSPYEIRMLGWSPQAVYQHTITFSFDVFPIEGDTWDNFNRQLFLLNDVTRRR